MNDLPVASHDLLTEVRARAGIPSPRLARAIRESAGVSQVRMAREMGVHRLTIARWESGARRPRGAQLVAYAQLLADLQRVGAA